MHACHVLQQKQMVQLLMSAFLQPDMLQHADTISLSVALHVGRKEGILSDDQSRQLQALYKPADISQTAIELHSAAKQGQFIPDQEWQDKLQAVCSQTDRAHMGALAQVLYAAAKTGKPATDEQIQQLVAALVAHPSSLSAAGPGVISGSLWAIATLGMRGVPVEHLQQLLGGFVDTVAADRRFLAAHHMSTTLWAAMVLDQQLQARRHAAGKQGQHTPLLGKRQLHQLASVLAELLGPAQASSVAQCLQASVHFRYLPLQLLQDSQLAPALLDTTGAPTAQNALVCLPQALQGMTTQHAADIAEALGYMGEAAAPLLRTVLRRAHERVTQGRKVTPQQASRLCWAAAVGGLEPWVSKPSSELTDQSDCADMVRSLARCCSSQWQDTTAADKSRLWQVHLWLQDTQPHPQLQPQGVQRPQALRRRRRKAADGLAAAQPVSTQGLQGVLTDQQLEQCRSNYLRDLQKLGAQDTDKESVKLHGSVLSVLQLLPVECWQVPPAAGGSTADGMFRVGIAAVTADGRQVAIEPITSQQGLRLGFEQDGNQGSLINGPTQLKLKALAARGYEVVPMPMWDRSAQHVTASRAVCRILGIDDRAVVARLFSDKKIRKRDQALARYFAQKFKPGPQ